MPQMPAVTPGFVSAALVMLLTFCVGGCQSSAPLYTPEAVRKPGNGKIYVYWPGQRWREQSGNRPALRVDGVPVGILRYKSYIELEMGPGEYELRLTGEGEGAKWNEPDHAFVASLDAGEIVYVRLLIKYDQTTNSLGHGLLDHVVLFLPRAEQEARRELRGLDRIGD